MTIISTMQHFVSGFRLNDYFPSNGNSVGLTFKIHGVEVSHNLYFNDPAEALALVRRLADARSTVTHKNGSEYVSQPLLPWLAALDIAAAVEAERAGAEELDDLEEEEETSEPLDDAPDRREDDWI